MPPLETDADAVFSRLEMKNMKSSRASAEAPKLLMLAPAPRGAMWRVYALREGAERLMI